MPLLLATPPFDAELLLHDGGLLLLAWILGGLVGWQREVQGRPAGLRTHALVCGGACLLARVSFSGAESDPGRIAAQIISGIGFLGAGVIMRRGVSVRGVTTAATIWVSAAIGIATAAGGRFAALAVIGTLFTLLTLSQARRLEHAIRRLQKSAVLTATFPRRASVTTRLITLLTDAGALIKEVDSERSEGASETNAERNFRTLHITLDLGEGLSIEEISAKIAEELPEVEFEWET